MTFRDFGVDEEEVKKVMAGLKFAVNLGLITDDSLQGVESRRLAKEAETTAALGENKIVYGISSYSRQAYIRYELTRFRLDFISEDSVINYKYTDISEKDAIDFYEKNRVSGHDLGRRTRKPPGRLDEEDCKARRAVWRQVPHH